MNDETTAPFENTADAFSRGFDRGNYGNAYESEDWESWYANNCEPDEDYTPAQRQAYQAGMILGFFSSYEIHEISDYECAEQVADFRTKYLNELSE